MTSIHQDKTTQRASLMVDYNAAGQTVLNIAPDDAPDGVQFTTPDRQAAVDIAERLVEGTLEASNLTDSVRTLLTGLDWAINGVPLPEEPVLDGEESPAADPDTVDEQGRALSAAYEENELLRGKLNDLADALANAVGVLSAALATIGRD